MPRLAECKSIEVGLVEAGSRSLDLQQEEAKFRRSKPTIRVKTMHASVQNLHQLLFFFFFFLSLFLDQTSFSISAYQFWWEVVQCGICEGKETPRIRREWDAYRMGYGPDCPSRCTRRSHRSGPAPFAHPFHRREGC